jgi:peptidoglycan/LPS O-acetylase OafA/YrhL
MNLDDLMAVWRTQDAAPLHGVDKTLLHLALRQDETKLQKARRIERWLIYVTSAGLVAGMAVFLSMMIYFRGHRPDRGVTGWDLALPIVGAAAALLAVRAMYVNHRAQSRREQSFGESLRDQLNRRIAQLDDQATSTRRTSVLVVALMGGVCPVAILLLGWRVNDKSISDDGYMLVMLLVVCVWSVANSVWEQRRSVQRDILPRKRRLEALLKELDAS